MPYVDQNDYPLDHPTGRTIELYQLLSDPEARQFRITNPPDFNSDINAVSLGLFKRMTGKWQMTASATWMRATGSLQEGQGGGGRGGHRGGHHPARRAAVPPVRPGSQQLRERRRTPEERRHLAVQGPDELPAARRDSSSPRTSPRATARTSCGARGRSRTSPHVPENRPILLQPRGENGRLQDVTILDFRLQKDFRLGGTVHLAAVRGRVQPAEQRHHGRGRDLARGVLVLSLPAPAGHSASLHAGREGQVLTHSGERARRARVPRRSDRSVGLSPLFRFPVRFTPPRVHALSGARSDSCPFELPAGVPPHQNRG